jgi:FAD/FMN-containing dehydrogenase
MKDLVQLLQEHNLWIPASGPGLERSVGGWIAAAAPAAWDACFGPVRRQLLGCRMVTPAGQPQTWGRAVMKNVAGYDVPRLMAGSRTRLGIMTTVTLRLWPRPAGISVHEIVGSEPGDLLEWTAADVVAWHWSRGRGEGRTVAFAGGAESVSRRRRALGDRAGGDARRLPSVLPPRTAGSVVYRLTPGRRYLPTTFAALTRTAEPNLAAIEAWPATGSMLVQIDAGPVPELPEPEPTMAVERGGPGVHERAAALRDPAISSIERKIERVFGAWPRSWLADYL